jgi:hypothetical protein
MDLQTGINWAWNLFFRKQNCLDENRNTICTGTGEKVEWVVYSHHFKEVKLSL